MSTQDDRTDDDQQRSDEGGQVSEVSGMGKAGEPVLPGDSVAGQPDADSGRADEGPTGPDAPTYDPKQDRYAGKDDVETTG
jgi:hypothetical protein